MSCLKIRTSPLTPPTPKRIPNLVLITPSPNTKTPPCHS